MVGKTIGPYRIVERLGAGGMGIVYRALDPRLGRSVALKFLERGAVPSTSDRERLVREARAASVLDHPNICTIHDIGETEEGELFIAMSCYAGGTLAGRIARGPIPLEEAIALFRQIAAGLAHAHRAGIVHRDIKPANVLLTDEGVPKISDFGLAHAAGNVSLTAPGQAVGTLAYMAPEQLAGSRGDVRSDLWSLGVLGLEMITGTNPFRADTAAATVTRISSAAAPAMPSSVDRIFRKLLARSPADRYASVTDLLGDVDRLQSKEEGSEKTLRSIAVLPFADLSPQKDQQYFCDGLADELLSVLARVEGIHVASRTSSFRFRDSGRDIREIARDLDVDTVLEGSVRKAASRIRVVAQLVSAGDGYQLWSSRFDSELEDIFAIQEQIADAVAAALSQHTAERAAAVQPPSVEAYDFYLRGRQLCRNRSKRGFDRAEEMFRRSIEIDPGFARAWAGLSDVCAERRLNYERSDAVLRAAADAARRALDLAPEIAESHVASGRVHMMENDFKQAEKEFEKATRIDPALFEGWYYFAHACVSVGRHERAAALYREALARDPDDYGTWIMMASSLRLAGREDEAAEAERRGAVAIDRQLDVYPQDPRAQLMKAVTVSRQKPVEAMRLTETAIAAAPDEPLVFYNAGLVLARLGRTDDALDALERSVDLGFPDASWLANDADFIELHRLPRFQKLLARLQS